MSVALSLHVSVLHVSSSKTKFHSSQAMHRSTFSLTGLYFTFRFFLFSARCIYIYISRLCYDVSVRLSATEVHWRIIANLGFKFRSKFTTRARMHACTATASACGRMLRVTVQRTRGNGSSPGRVERSYRAMLATARHSCFVKLSKAISRSTGPILRFFFTKLKVLCECFQSGPVFTARCYAKRGICRRRVSVCLSVCVCVCVCLSHSGIVSKRLNVGSSK